MFTIAIWIANQLRIIQLAKQSCKRNLHPSWKWLCVTVWPSICVVLQREAMQAIRQEMIIQDYPMCCWIYQFIYHIYIYTWESKIHHLECWTSRKIRRSSWICCWYQVLPLRFGQSTCIRRYTIIYSKKSLNNSSKTNLPKGTVWNRRPVSKQHKEATKKEVNCKGLDHSTLSKISAAIFISVWQGRIFCGFWSIQLCIVPPKRWMASSPVLLCFTKDSI